MAEKGGFEPPRPLFGPAPLAGVCIRPLCHFSAAYFSLAEPDRCGLPVLKEEPNGFGSPIEFLVRQVGFEPATPWFVARYSIQLSYWRTREGEVYACEAV